MLLANQCLFTRRESNFGGNNVSFEINSREKEIFKYVQMALPKKVFKCFFLWWNTASWSCRTFIEQLQIIKNLQVKACWLRSVLKAVGWSTIFHELKSVVKAKIAQIHSQVSEGGITVKLGQESIPELIIWKVNQFFASITCSQYQIAFKWSVNFWLQFLVYDEMENISMDEISI